MMNIATAKRGKSAIQTSGAAVEASLESMQLKISSYLGDKIVILLILINVPFLCNCHIRIKTKGWGEVLSRAIRRWNLKVEDLLFPCLTWKGRLENIQPKKNHN